MILAITVLLAVLSLTGLAALGLLMHIASILMHQHSDNREVAMVTNQYDVTGLVALAKIAGVTMDELAAEARRQAGGPGPITPAPMGAMFVDPSQVPE
jgi:hypothetical protein